MAGKYKYELMLSYPHMSKDEAYIWELFMLKYPDYFESVDYDVPVGTPREYPKGYPFGITELMEQKSRKRIDVVGYSMDKAFIIEVERNAMPSVFGDVLAKTKLFKEEHPEFKEYFPMVITDRENPDMIRLAKDFGVIFYIV